MLSASEKDNKIGPTISAGQQKKKKVQSSSMGGNLGFFLKRMVQAGLKGASGLMQF